VRATHPLTLVRVAVILCCLAVPLSVCPAAVMTLHASEMAVIQDPTDSTQRRALVRFDAPERLSSGVVELALLELRTAVSAADSSESVMLDCYPVTTSWSSGSVDWAHGWNSPGGDFDLTRHSVCTAAVGDSVAIRFDVTRLVSGWSADDMDTHGIIITVSPLESGVLQARRGGGEVHALAPALRIWYTPVRDD
jgi:hypothetical protein